MSENKKELTFDEKMHLMSLLISIFVIAFGIVTNNIYFCGLGFVIIALILLIPKDNFKIKFWTFEINVEKNKKD